MNGSKVKSKFDKKNVFKNSLFIFLIALFFSNQLPGSSQKFAKFDQFVLANGDTLSELKVGYRIFGRLNEQSPNAILFASWFSGTSEHLSHLLGKDKLLDSTKYFIICVDALGNGISSSPSNHATCPDSLFPQITIRDMVNSQYQMLTQELHITHLRAIIGGSMGGMQVFEWLIAYPDFMDKAIAYVSTPKPSNFDQLIFHTYLQIIDSGLESNMPEREILTNLRMTEALIGRTPSYFIHHFSDNEIANFIDSFKATNNTSFTVYDWRCQTNAMIAHDITRQFAGDWQKTACRVKAKTLIIVSETDHYLNPNPAIKFSELIDSDLLILKSDCGHLAVGCELRLCREKIENFLEK